ncbi:hypothetical protein [Desulfovibrio falkowii]|uniref:hypothetical protein n=1 Tax=Desulfovibrio sp. WGS1351 TaxID=3366814 RepID=UPI00372D188B
MVERVSELKELKDLFQAWGLEEAEAKNAAIYIIYGSSPMRVLFKKADDAVSGIDGASGLTSTGRCGSFVNFTPRNQTLG